MKRKSIYICIAMCLLCAATLPVSVSATSMSALTSDSIKEKENQISQAEKEKEELEDNLSDLKEIKKELESQKTDLKNYVAKLDDNLAQIEQNIAELKAQIATKEEEITLTEAELKSALEREENQQESMIARIRLMYETNDSYIVERLL